MKISHISIIAVLFVVASVAIAGCTGSSPSASGSVSAATAGGTGSSSSSASGSVSGSQILGGVTYEWAEYRIASNYGGEPVAMFFKFNQKTGKCTMRIEGMEEMAGMLTDIDCSSGGSTGGTASDPNDIGDVKLTKVGTETVTVPAGTFVADKYTVSSQGQSATYWIVAGKPLVKMQGGNTEGTTVMELAGWG